MTVRDVTAAATRSAKASRFRVILDFAAGYADRILKGQKPGDIPVQLPEPYQLHLNKRAAAAIGLTLPADLVAEAGTVLFGQNYLPPPGRNRS